MKRYRGWIILFLVLALCVGIVWLILHTTAEYPTLGEAVSYPVNVEENSETMENVKPPAIFYQGETSQRWFEVGEKELIVQIEEIGAVRFQNLEQCDIVGTVSCVENNIANLTEELSVNLSSSVDVGTPVYSTIIDGELWLIVEGAYGGERYQFYFGTWALQKER